MICMHGCSGSGKSTLAKQLLTQYMTHCEDFGNKLVRKYSWGVILSTDTLFEAETIGARPDYLWHPESLGLAHKLNQAKARHACKIEVGIIIIDNTNLVARDVYPYYELAKEFGYEFEIREPETGWRYDANILAGLNVHRVGREVIDKMLARRQSPEDMMVKLEEIWAAQQKELICETQ